ncbi:MAG: GatB/YqeY domain-containing protein, partial [Candidatus Sericytochromatia bacterium]
MLKSTVQQDLKTAMKAGNAPERDALRLLLAAITSAEKAEGRDLTEPEAQAVVTRLVKQANNSIEEYKRLDQADTVAKLEGELAIYKRYAPEQMGEDQVRAIVVEAVAEAGATG